jgi:hypothetical protein
MTVVTIRRYCPTCQEDRPMTVVGNDDHLWLHCPHCEDFQRLDIEDVAAL